MPPAPIAIAHDYLTQRGGAERVVLALTRAFPAAPLHTTVYEPSGTFAEFGASRVSTTGLQSVGPLRRNPRLALPLLAPTVRRHRIDAQATICSTSGWAHGFPVTGAKVLYVHNTARWLYQSDEYLANLPRWYRAGLAPLSGPLRRWDATAAAEADVVLANSAVTAARIRTNWGREAEVLHPPPGLTPEGRRRPVPHLEPGFFLTVARLLPYKRVDVVIEAAARRAGRILVVVGDGPDAARLRSQAPTTTRFLPTVDDEELRWLYANAAALVTAAHDDFGLTPLEAMGFGTPVVAVDEGGYRETVQHEETGLLFPSPTSSDLCAALDEFEGRPWDRSALADRAAAFSELAFGERLREVVRALGVDAAPGGSPQLSA